jgi:putative endonuclease
MSPYFFYLARCSDKSLYSGTTVNLKARERRHNAGRGARYTASRRPIEIVYHEEFETLLDARRREAEVKRWQKARKEKLVTQGR